MAMKGERFELDLDPEEAYARSQGKVEDGGKESKTSSSLDPLGIDFVKDVLEHAPDPSAPPPEALRQKQNTNTGFPAHGKRESRFKRARARGGEKELDKEGPSAGSSGSNRTKSSALGTPGIYLSKLSTATDDEKRDVDRVSSQMLASMPADELEEARKQISEDPSFATIRRLLDRANIDSDTRMAAEEKHTQTNTSQKKTLRKQSDTHDEDGVRAVPSKKVAFAERSETVEEERTIPRQAEDNDRTISSPKAIASVPAFSPKDIAPVSTSASTYRTPFYRSKYPDNGSPILADENTHTSEPQLPNRNTHTVSSVPSVPKAPLDLNSNNFLSDLHSTYYPDLPSDPSRLAWMKPIESTQSSNIPTITTTDTSTPEVASSTVVDPATPSNELRFDMRGAIVSATRGAKIPVTKGLHHHGREPGAAGYTINELAIYAHSTLAAQRCFAYMLLGRVLYRLGCGEFRLDGRRRNEAAQSQSGESADTNAAAANTGLPTDEREEGLWREVGHGHILDQIMTEAARSPGTGSESARVWAVEALWLWRKGGGRGLEDLNSHDIEGDVMGDAAGQILEEGLNPQF